MKAEVMLCKPTPGIHVVSQPEITEERYDWPADESCLNTEKAVSYILFTLVFRKQILK